MQRPVIGFGLPLPGPDQLQIAWGQLYGSARSLAISEVVSRHDGWVCVLADSASTAEQLAGELAFFGLERALHRFSDYETLPYDAFTPPQDLLAERLATLYELCRQSEPAVLLANAAALLNRLPPPEFVLGRSLQLAVGERLDIETMRRRLVQHGYLAVEQVAEPGEFAVRGALLDVFPSGAQRPVRIDIFDDEIESLRLFDPETQLTTERIETVRVLPAREFPFDEEAIRGFRARFRERLPGNPARSAIYSGISQAELPPGIEYYLPLFFDRTVSLLDYLPENTLLVLVEGANAEIERGWQIASERHTQLCGDLERPILPPEQAFWPPDSLIDDIETRARLILERRELESGPASTVYNAATEHPLSRAATLGSDPIESWLAGSGALRSLIVATSLGRREAAGALLEGRGIEVSRVDGWREFLGSAARCAVTAGEVDAGMRLAAHGIELVTAGELGVERPSPRTRRRRAARAPETIIRELTDLRIGAPVVHEEYGVGRYCGLTTLDVDDVLTEFLTLEYAGGDKLYVPVQNLHLVTRYSGASPENAPLHRLGSDQWSKARQKAAHAARDAAAELLNIYAQRAARPGVAIALQDDSYQRFALEFPFEETDDQLEAINAVLTDLEKAEPMDRLVCGDVGFGKTEVALRAAFVAVHAGHQVALLVPDDAACSTALPHVLGSICRMACPRRVAVEVSQRQGQQAGARGNGRWQRRYRNRHSSAAAKRRALQATRPRHRRRRAPFRRAPQRAAQADEGGCPLAHAHGNADPENSEHDVGRPEGPFHHRHTARRSARGQDFRRRMDRPADPRRADARDQERRPSLCRSQSRRGYRKVAARIGELVPEASVHIAHGQMSERALETAMLDFYQRRYNVLVCTTIIESGIDIPNANTMIINRAHHFGLAELHQLRGRVGRSHHQAYAYLIAPPRRALSADAAKRLEAIEALEELGSGFTLATHDLEIRGAGEMLGEEQSGQIHAVGFALYNELLARAVEALRDGREPELEDPFHHGPEVALGVVALIPEDYMPDVHTRLTHYKRIANASSQEELDELEVELIDRFGLLPAATKTLFAITWLKLLAQSIGVAKVQAAGSSGVLHFAKDAHVDPHALVELVSDDPERYRLDGAFKLAFKWRAESGEKRIAELERLLRCLGAGRETAAAPMPAPKHGGAATRL